MKLKIDLSGSIGFELLSSSLSLSLSCRHAFICRCVGLCVAFFMANFCLAPSTEPHSFVGELRQDPLSPQNTNKFLRSNLSHVDSHYGFLCFLYFLCAQFSNSPQDLREDTHRATCRPQPPEKERNRNKTRRVCSHYWRTNKGRGERKNS